MGRKPKNDNPDLRLKLWRLEIAKRVKELQGDSSIKEFLSQTGLTRAMYYVIIGGRRDYNIGVLLKALSGGKDPVTEAISTLEKSMKLKPDAKTACRIVVEAYADDEIKPQAAKLVEVIAMQVRHDSRDSGAI